MWMRLKESLFPFPYGKTLAVVGESGSGKSVTAMACTQLLPKPPICKVSGEIWFEGRKSFSFI
jgi:ABC-type dipeptide/oligopeptide/nickel transport system ATPase component